MAFKTTPITLQQAGKTRASIEAVISGEEEPQALSLAQLPEVLSRLAEESDTFLPLLPALFQLNGSPYTLRDHFVFHPLYSRALSKAVSVKAGRQIGKSANLATSILARSAAIRNFKTLFVAPQEEQTRRFSTNYVGQFIKNSPVREVFMASSTGGSVYQKDFSNGSRAVFSFAQTDADRTRGVDADALIFDECVHTDTLVHLIKPNGLRGQFRAANAEPGDLILGFDSQGRALWAPVKAVHFREGRKTFKLLTENGSQVTATSDTWVATDAGWKTVSDIITYLNRGGEPESDPYYDLMYELQSEDPDQSIGPQSGIELGREPDIFRQPMTKEQREAQDQELGYDMDRPWAHPIWRAWILTLPEAEPEKEPGMGVGAVGPGGQALTLKPSRLRYLGWEGDQQTLDIEVEGLHTFIAGGVAVHNCQNIERSVIPIIVQVMSHSPWRLSTMAGTPLTNDNLLEHTWQNSDMSEWIIRCTHCTTGGKPTCNIPSLDHHLEAMLGPLRSDISEQYPGTICHKCRKPISPRFGSWVPRNRDKVGVHQGLHIPQILLPLHYANRQHWGELLAYREGYNNTTPAQFHNEILGESYDRATKLVTETDLRKVARGIGPNAVETRGKLGPQIIYWAMGIDWGGGGGQHLDDSLSFTTAALVGLGVDGRLYVPWGIRLLTPHDQIQEATVLKHYLDIFQPDVVAHDYNGAGEARLTIMIQSGFDARKVMHCVYNTVKGAPVRYIKPTDFTLRPVHQVDKARTLGTLCRAIQLNGVQFFDWDYQGEGRRGLLYDFLSLVEEKRRGMLRDTYGIGCAIGTMDDFAQAVNFGAVACWNNNDAWPDYFKLTQKAQADGFFSVKV